MPADDVVAIAQGHESEETVGFADDVRTANAALIVAAVNAHDAAGALADAAAASTAAWKRDDVVDATNALRDAVAAYRVASGEDGTDG